MAAQLLALAIMPAAAAAPSATPEDQSGFELSAPAGLSTSNIQDLRTLSSRELFSSATESARAGRLEEAIAAFRELLRRDPDNVAGHNNLACCLKRQGDSASALAEFEKAVAANPGKAALQVNLARALVDLGQYDRAIETIYLSLRLESTAQAQLLLGRALSLKGDYASAIPAFQEALKADPGITDAHLELGDALRAVYHYEQALIEYKIAESRIKVAAEHEPPGAAESSKDTKATKATKEASVTKETVFDCSRIQLRQAKCYEGLAQFEKARTILSALLEKTPDDTDCLNCLGVVLWKLGHAPEAAFVLERALKQDPSFLQARNNLGIVLYDLKRYQDSVDVWRQALGLKPDYPQAHYNIGVALYQGGLFEQSADAFKECLKYAPQDANAHNNLGLALLKLGDRSAAINEWKRALECDANLSEARTNLAKISEGES